LEVEGAGRSDIISFVSGGHAFQVHKPDKFFKDIVPLYFRQSRLSSFKRQLNLYGFELINTGPCRGGYFHELFMQDQPELCRRMRRVAVKVAVKYETTDDDGEENETSDGLDMQRPNAGLEF
jgi:HSF-type DNA-binding